MDLNSAGYGALMGIIVVLGIGAFISSRRAQKAEGDAQRAQTDLKVEQKKQEDDSDPIDDAISKFDHDLDDDSKK